MDEGSASEIVLIGDDRIRRIPVVECGDPMIDLLQEFPELKFDHSRLHVRKSLESISLSRRKVGERLRLAQSLLPAGVHLLIKECHRPMSEQKKSWDWYVGFLKEKYPSWSATQIDEECSKLNAPLDVAPHVTGAAVDLTLVDEAGEWLEMGTEFNASPLMTNGATYTAAENISAEAKANRALLSSAMVRAGFVNYPTEWWHWSYGDKYWAFVTQQPHAIFDFRESMVSAT